jgi:hypothetical protein
MVYEFELYRPSYYNSRLYSYYYPTTSTYYGSYDRPTNVSRYYKPYWSYSPYSQYSSYSTSYPYSYRPYRYDYAYGWPYHYTYRDINPKIPSLSAILANDDLDRAKRAIRAKSLELDNYNFGRASSVPRFARETSLEPSYERFLTRSSLERELY